MLNERIKPQYEYNNTRESADFLTVGKKKKSDVRKGKKLKLKGKKDCSKILYMYR